MCEWEQGPCIIYLSAEKGVLLYNAHRKAWAQDFAHATPKLTPRSEFIQGNMKYNPVTLSPLQMEDGRWPPFLLASYSALQREIWGVELPAASAAGASEDAVGEGLRLGPGNMDQAKYLLWTLVCAPCRAAGVTGPFLLLCKPTPPPLLGVLWEIPSIILQKNRSVYVCSFYIQSSTLIAISSLTSLVWIKLLFLIY